MDTRLYNQNVLADLKLLEEILNPSLANAQDSSGELEEKEEGCCGGGCGCHENKKQPTKQPSSEPCDE
jgi:hypothetical protein